MFRKLLLIGLTVLLLQGCSIFTKKVNIELMNWRENYDVINHEVDFYILRSDMNSRFDVVGTYVFGESQCFVASNGTHKWCEIQTDENTLYFDKWACNNNPEETDSPTSVLKRQISSDDSIVDIVTTLYIEKNLVTFSIQLYEPGVYSYLIELSNFPGDSILLSVSDNWLNGSFNINIGKNLYVFYPKSGQLSDRELEYEIVDGACITSEASFDMMRKMLAKIQDKIDLMIINTREMYSDIKVDIDSYIRLDEIARLINETSFWAR